jgi:hypothetical protein
LSRQILIKNLSILNMKLCKSSLNPHPCRDPVGVNASALIEDHPPEKARSKAEAGWPLTGFTGAGLGELESFRFNGLKRRELSVYVWFRAQPA